MFTERQRLDAYYAFFQLRGLFYRGNKYYCNCCNTLFRKFLPYGNVRRSNALCPSCHSLERTRVLSYYLQNEVKAFERNLKILHFAPERVLERRFKECPFIEYISADINPALADIKADICSIPFEAETFDLVICAHVLGHVKDEHKAIDEIYRVLKVGGEAILMTLIDKNNTKTYEDNEWQTESERLSHYGEVDLVRLHGSDFAERLARENVFIDVIDYRLQFDAQDLAKLSLGNGDRELIYLAKKLKPK